MPWFKRYKLLFVLLLFILFVSLFIMPACSVEGFESGYSKIEPLDVNFRASLDKLLSDTSVKLRIKQPIPLPSEDDFNSYSENAKIYNNQLSRRQTKLTNIKNRQNELGGPVNYTTKTVSDASDALDKINLLIKEIKNFKRYLPTEMKTMLDDMYLSIMELHNFTKKYYSIKNITTSNCPTTAGGVTNCNTKSNVGTILTTLMLPVVDYNDKYSGNGIKNPKPLVLTASDFSTGNKTLSNYLDSVKELDAFIIKLENDPIRPWASNNKSNLRNYTQVIKTKIQALNNYIKNYNQNKPTTMTDPDDAVDEAVPGVAAVPVVKVVPNE
jgi:hypothetical protein